MSKEKKKRPGRGWRGDSEGHARAGKLGGLAHGKNKSKEDQKENESNE